MTSYGLPGQYAILSQQVQARMSSPFGNHWHCDAKAGTRMESTTLESHYKASHILRVSDVESRQRLRSATTSALVGRRLNVPRSAIVPLLLPHRLFGTVYLRTCGRQHHCQCFGVGWRPSSTDAHSALDSRHSVWHSVWLTCFCNVTL